MNSLPPSHWLYPGALNQSLILAERQNPNSNSGFDETELLKAAAAEGARSKPGEFGSNDVEVHVGDVIIPEWRVDMEVGMRTVDLYCAGCRGGKEKYGRGGVWSACDNYTSTLTFPFHDAASFSPPRTPYTIPPLSQLLTLPNSTVALCFFRLSDKNGFNTMDFSILFPVLQEPRFPHYMFRMGSPTGLADTSIVATSTAPALITGDQYEEGKGLNTGKIVAAVLGGMGAVVLGALLYWLFLKRRTWKDAKGIRSAESSPNMATERGG
ncbi:uncharacterized protein BDR25DRAFT_346288, partial [Lindgomyces ingoldianus]